MSWDGDRPLTSNTGTTPAPSVRSGPWRRDVPISSDPFIRYVHGKAPEIFLVLYLSLLVCGTFVPYRMSSESHAAPSKTAQVRRFPMTFRSAGLKDILPNMLLYVPLGAASYVVARRRGWRRHRALVGTVMFGALFSGAAEWSQQFAALRVSSWVDVVSNTLGGLVGAVLARTGRGVFNRMVGRTRFELTQTPVLTVARAYLVLLILTGVIPLDVTFDRSRLGQAVRRAQWVPFGPVRVWNEQVLEVRRAGDLPRQVALRRAEVDFWLDLVAEGAAFGLLGGLLALGFRRECRSGRLGAWSFAAWGVARWAVLLSVLQLFIMSRGWDTTDIVVRTLAGWVGALAASSGVGRIAVLLAGRGRPAARVLTALVVAYIVCRDFSPFLIEPGGPLTRGWSQINWAPLAGYFFPRISSAVDDILYKILRYGVLGIVAAMACGPIAGRSPYHRRALRIAGWGAGLSTVIEICQVMIPTRFPDLTHVLLAGFGAYAGAVAARWAKDYYEATREQWSAWRAAVAAPPPIPVPAPVLFNVDVPPPRDDAPKESVQKTHP